MWKRTGLGYFEGRRAKAYLWTIRLIWRVGVAPFALSRLAYWVLRPRRVEMGTVGTIRSPRKEADQKALAAWHDSTRNIPADRLRDAYDRIGALTGMDSTWKILDVNCGTGRLTIPLAASGFEVTGIDASSDMLEQAKSQLQTGSQRSFVCGDAEEMQFPDNCFDAAIIARLFLHIGNAAQVTRELVRVVRPGGTVIVLHGKAAFDNTPLRQFRKTCDERGYLPQRQRSDRQAISAAIAALNMTHLLVDVSDLKWTKTMTHRESIEHLRLRVHSEFWLVPPGKYDEILSEMQEQLSQQPDGLETEDLLNASLEIDLYVKPS